MRLLTATVLTGFACTPCGASAFAAITEDAATPKPWQGEDVTGQGKGNEQAPVDLEADLVTHDEQAQTIVASGNVELIQSGRIVKADTMTYNLRTEEVRAVGNVVFSEADGTTYFADDAVLERDMKDGFVQGLQILLADGSRFTARDGKRTNGTKVVLKDASYTPCDLCKEDPTRAPVWQLRADEVTHDEDDKSISYHNAWFELFGVPLFYTPYFTHPDGTEDQKSGVLPPLLGYDSELGASYQQEYYYAIAPDKDLTLGAMVATDVNPVALAQYRQRFENADIDLSGSATSSGRKDSVAGMSRDVGDEARGHLFGKGRWDLNDQWRTGFNAAVASDDQYLRQYNIDSDDVLENELFAERFSDRDYTVARALAFQDVRVSDRQQDQPAVLPEIVSSFYGDPNALFGGRWNAELSALGLYRDGNGQDVGRTSLEVGWQRRYITNFGLVNKLDGTLRGDAYNVHDRQNVLIPDDGDSTQTRGFAQANLETSYPLEKRFETSQMVVSPLVSVTTGTNVDFDGDIPNEDSQDFSLDATNLFEPNRSPGYDLIEDRSHATYGLRTGLYGDEGWRGEAFFGQSVRFENGDNPFNEGSGLSDKRSDYVGQLAASFGGAFNFDYRFQLEDDTFASRRHELNLDAVWDRLTLGTRYFYAAAIEDTDLNQSREQIRPVARFRLFDEWYMVGGLWYDFGENEGLRQASYGFDYVGQCLTFSLLTQRTLTQDDTGDSGTQIMLRIGLKNLGEFETSGITIGDNSRDGDTDTTDTASE